MKMERENVCRLCATGLVSRNAHDVFINENVPDHEPLTFLITHYLRIHIYANDNLPSVVCDDCCDRILSFDTFAIKCNEVQERFKLLQDKKESPDYSIQRSSKTKHYTCDPMKEEDDLSVKSEKFEDDFSDVEDNKPIIETVNMKLKIRIDSHERKSDPLNTSTRRTLRKKSIHSNKSMKKRFSNTKNIIDTTKRRKFILDTRNSFFDFSCHVCGHTLTTWKFLKDHCKKVHEASPRVKCVCDKYLYTRRSVSRHLIIHDSSQHPFICDICGRSFGYRNAIVCHLRSHIPKEDCQYVCSQCSKKFASATSLKLHEAIHTPKELRLVYPCPLCESKFATKGHVQSHIKAIHEKHRPYICDICGYACTTKGSLQDHRLVHTDKRPYSCNYCSQTFKAKSHLQRHVKNGHNDTKVQCPHCSVLLKNRRTLRKHLNIHKSTFQFNCTICSKGFNSKLTFSSHMNSHNGVRPFTCLWCSKSFAENTYLRVHEKRMHPVEIAECDGLQDSTGVGGNCN